MANIEGQLDDLRARIESLSSSASASEVSALEAEARALMVETKNTPLEAEAKALFTQLARRSAAPESSGASEVRALLRRARIRIDVATDDHDIDEAIDILAEALDLDPDYGETHTLLSQAAARSAQHALKVQGLLERYGIDAAPPPPAGDYDEPAAYTPPPPPSFTPAPQGGSIAPLPPEGDPAAEVSKAYYAGDYQRAVELADRVLAADPNNAQAADYRHKSEDNLLRGVVPDHRIPFDARVAYNRANSLVRAGNYDEAQALYQQARDLAARAGIPSWNDVEQALLDIQDLALARELLNDGDRMLAGDDWEGALRKYEGALRVVPNDPLAEERVELVSRIKEQFDQATVQINMMSGSLMDRADALNRLVNNLASIRQTLPGSERLGQLVAEVRNRSEGIRTQLLSQASGLITRAESAASLDEKAKLSQESRSLLAVAVGLDPTDPSANSALQRAEQIVGSVEETRQNLDRSAMLIAQNTEGELAQARNLLASMGGYASDSRYRTAVADLLASHLGYIEAALDRGDVNAAERWLKISKEEPFRILGRRTELLHMEDEIRRIKRGRFVGRMGVIVGLIAILVLVLYLSRNSWVGVVAPSPTPTSTATLTPSVTPTPTDTPTPTPTYTPSTTPSPTITPSYTNTASLTPTHTDTPTHTFTPSITPTASDTLPPSETPSITPTTTFLCRVFVNDNVRVRSRPSTSADVIITATRNTAMEVLEQRISDTDGLVWYRVRLQLEGATVEGWLRGNLVVEITECPRFGS